MKRFTKLALFFATVCSIGTSKYNLCLEVSWLTWNRYLIQSTPKQLVYKPSMNGYPYNSPLSPRRGALSAALVGPSPLHLSLQVPVELLHIRSMRRFISLAFRLVGQRTTSREVSNSGIPSQSTLFIRAHRLRSQWYLPKDPHISLMKLR
jgi:hypothetical protein